MAEFDAKKMDDAANDASLELETIREKHPDGVEAVEEWTKKWVRSAGYTGRQMGIAFPYFRTLFPVF